MAGIVLLCVGVVLVGVVMSSPPSADFPNSNRYDVNARPNWWHGVALGSVGSIIGGLTLLVAGIRQRKDGAVESENPSQADSSGSTRSRKSEKGSRSRRKSKSDDVPASGLNLHWLSLVIWIAAAGMTVHLMRVVFSESVPVPSQKATTLLWNVDDVAYVSEATDYLYGVEMGRYEPSTGGTATMGRGAMSPLIAPLVAMIAKLTGVTPPGLHHSLMPPLMILIGSSCLACVLSVIFRNDRWLVPLGLLVSLLLISKSWDYARCEVEMIAFRAMQTKAIHLIWVQPLQLASMLLLVTRPSWKHLTFAVCVAIVAHTTHPFATINAMVWSTALVAGSLIFDRKAIVHLLIILVFSCGLAGLFHTVSQNRSDGTSLSSGRKKGTRIQSRDVVRIDVARFTMSGDLEEQLQESAVSDEVRRAFKSNGAEIPRNVNLDPELDGAWTILYGNRPLYRIRRDESKLVVYECDAQPTTRHDPFWSFGLNTLYTASALSVPLLLAFGFRRREVFYLGCVGAAALLACNVELLGRLLNHALPMSIFWRGRWMVPQLVSVAALAGMIHWSVTALIRGRRESITGMASVVASIVTLAGIGGMLVKSTSMTLKTGDAPKNLTKFSDDMHGLVDLLEGVESDPYLFGPFMVQHELPQ